MTQENYTHKELPLPSWAAQGSLVQKTQDLRFEEELFLSLIFPHPRVSISLSKQTQHWNIQNIWQVPNRKVTVAGFHGSVLSLGLSEHLIPKDHD